MKSTETSASPVYTVIQTIRGIKGTFKRTATFIDESANMQYAWTCVHAPNGEWISCIGCQKQDGVCVIRLI